jgi:hypothetical protein
LWLNTASVMARIEFANALVKGQIPGAPVDSARFAGKTAAEISHELLNREPSKQTLTAIEQGLQGKQPGADVIAGLVISSPEFQRR